MKRIEDLIAERCGLVRVEDCAAPDWRDSHGRARVWEHERGMVVLVWRASRGPTLFEPLEVR